MDYLLEVLGRVGIFIVLVQTILHFKANDSYEKYIKMLTNIMILSMLMIPAIGIFNKNIPRQMNQQIAFYQRQLQEIEHDNLIEQEIEDDTLTQNQFIRSFEEEVKSKINDTAIEEKYEVQTVKITGIEKDGSYDEEKFLVRIVARQKENTLQKIKIEKIQINDGANQENEIKKKYAEILGIDEIYLEVEISE